MRVCFVNPSVGTTTGGVETTIRALANILSENHEVSVLTGHSPHKSTIPFPPGSRVDVITVPYWPRFTPPNEAAGRLVRTLDPYHIEAVSFFLGFLGSARAKRLIATSDVISTHYRVDSALFSSWAHRRKVASVFHVQGVNLGHLYRFLDRSDRYVAVGVEGQRYIEERSGIQMHSIVTPGIPERMLSIPRREEDALLFVARLQPSKRPDWAIRVFHRLASSFPTLTLRIIGSGPSVEDLRRLVVLLDLEDRVDFLGEIPSHEVEAHYAVAKLLLMPTIAEVFPLVPLEAMAAGCPVVGTDIPAMRESAEPAVFVPQDDMDAWVESTREVLLSSERRRELSAKGREWAAKHTWRRSAEAYEKELLLARDARLGKASRESP